MDMTCAKPHLGHHEALATVGVVNRHVEAHGKEVLVDLGVEAGREQGAVRGHGALPGAQHVGR
jgi:hypothetical protein